jgi:hypothetical protein
VTCLLRHCLQNCAFAGGFPATGMQGSSSSRLAAVAFAAAFAELPACGRPMGDEQTTFAKAAERKGNDDDDDCMLHAAGKAKLLVGRFCWRAGCSSLHARCTQQPTRRYTTTGLPNERYMDITLSGVHGSTTLNDGITYK